MSDKILPQNSLQPKYILGIDESIREALARLDVIHPKLCVVVDSDGTLVRTISDGDIRRGLLKNFVLDNTITQLPGRPPVFAHISTDPKQLLKLLLREKVDTIILVDDEHRPVDLKKTEELEGRILLSPPHIGENETSYIQQAFDTNWIAPAGPNIEKFEERLAETSGRNEAIAVTSGTAGIHLALRALELTEGTPIYVSDKTFVASLQPILYERLKPVLIDSEPVSWNMSPQALKRRLQHDASANRLPGAIVLVHLYGQPADVDKIIALADQYDIPVIEDAAESLGARYLNRPSGSHGLISVFSFNGNKIITTSSGGAVVTDDSNLARRIRFLATQGKDPFEHYQHSHVAYNYRMSNILAGIGIGQLEVLAERVDRRRAIYAHYNAGLKSIPGVGSQQEIEGSVGNRWLTVITLDPDIIDIHPYQLLRSLQQRGIEARPSFKPMHMQPLCQGFTFEPHSECELVSSSVFFKALCLPSGSSMTDASVERVISETRDIIERGTL